MNNEVSLMSSDSELQTGWVWQANNSTKFNLWKPSVKFTYHQA